MSIKPTAPPGRMIKEGLFCYGSCPICGSALKHRWFKAIGCIQPRCANYYKTRHLIRPEGSSLLCSKVPCIACGRIYVPTDFLKDHFHIGVPPILLNNYCSRKCYDREGQ